MRLNKKLPNKCPECQNDDLDWEDQGEEFLDRKRVFVDIVRCQDCGFTWKEYWEFSGWEPY